MVVLACLTTLVSFFVPETKGAQAQE